MRTVGVGPGATGGSLGAYLIRARHGMLPLDSVAEHGEAIRDRSLRLGGRAELTVA